ncbi:MAG: class I SAM-dependent methyltransferase [Candidatus Omnitrophica bacterium]|nr:class I SAM-dependent methyltransferase [Candidatus Omnitrophota bacterium]MDD5500677.1 class I SAM-dependent methyltransferase [Candidatus Omnitrophota bacterium]
MKDNTKLFYDLTAGKTAGEWYGNNILLPTIKELISLLPENPRVLDLGCGPGHETKRLKAAGAEAIGIDYSSECIRIAKQRCPECEFEVMDFRSLDEGLGQFDGIFASGSLIHLNQHELPLVIGKLSHMLRNGGYFLMIVQDGEGVNQDWSNLEVEGNNLRRTVYCYSKSRLLPIVSETGLEFKKEGYLDKSLYEHNWRNYIFKRI